MSVKPDSWIEAYHEIVREERGRGDEWPTEESLFAFSRQELEPAEARKVRKFLVAYPEIAAALAELDEPFSSSAKGPEGLTDVEIEQDWSRLMTRLEKEATFAPPAALSEPKRPKKPRQRSPVGWWLGTLAASAAAFALGSLLAVSPFSEPSPPIALRSRLLIPDGQRGTTQEPIPVASDEGKGGMLLSLGSLEPRPFDEYRLSIHEVRDGREIERFHQGGLRRNEADAFDLLLPPGSLSPGLYRLRLVGNAGGANTLLATYSIRLR